MADRLEMPCLPLRELVLLPDTRATVYVVRPPSRAALAAAGIGGRLFVVPQRNADTYTPGQADLFEVGTVGEVLRTEAAPDGTTRATIRGLARAVLESFRAEGDTSTAALVTIDEDRSASSDVAQRMAALREALATARARIAELGRVLLALGIRAEGVADPASLATVDDPVALVHAAAESLPAADKQAILQTIPTGERLALVVAAVRARVPTDAGLAARWLDDVRRNGERLAGEARLLRDVLHSPDARRPLSPLEAAAEALQRAAQSELKRLR